MQRDQYSGFESSRRRFMEYAAAACLGVTMCPTWGRAAEKPAPISLPGGGTAKRVIYLFMTGAMSHLETFDLKPGREVQGETEGIATNVPGMSFGAGLPQLAKLANHMAVIRSMHTETGDHDGGQYLIRTSYKEIASIRHPAMGAWMQEAMGIRKDRKLPDNILINGSNRHPGAGFLNPAMTPVPVSDPKAGLQNTKAPDYVKADSFDRRMKLIDTFDSDFRQQFPQKKVEAYSEFYSQARALMESSELKVFNLAEEKDSVRKKYGDNSFGQGCLLARRLAERDTRFIEVGLGGWDMHVDIFKNFSDRAAVLDQGMSALIQELEALGLLKDTLVVLTTEFGRSPRINVNDGRDHHPAAFSSVLVGGGVKGGQFYGTSDKDGQNVEDNGVGVDDFNATIAHALGLPIQKEYFSPSGRPFKVAHDGKPILKLLG